jgi:hypothetical protein
MERRIAALAAQVVRLGADLDGEVPSSPAPPPEGSALKNAIIASAEAAAAGIRASAEREARRIRGRAAGPASERVSRFVTMIARQREMLATLVLEADRVGHATARLNALTQALDAELQTLLRSVRSGER